MGKNVELTNVQNVPFWCGLPVQQFQTLNWMNTFKLQKKNTVIMLSKHLGCYFGISTIWIVLFKIWLILRLFLMNGVLKTKYFLSRLFNFTENLSIGFVKCYPINP